MIAFMFSLQGLNAIHHVVKGVLDKRMANWEKYCFQQCFYVPEGFVVPDDVCTLSQHNRFDSNMLNFTFMLQKKIHLCYPYDGSQMKGTYTVCESL